MDRATLRERLRETFLAELADHAGAMNRGVLALEAARASGGGEHLETLLRTLHTLKGAARSQGITPVSEACHWAEELLIGVRDKRVPLDADAIDLLYQLSDAIADAGRRLGARQDLAGSALEGLAPRLAKAAPPGGPPRASGTLALVPPAAVSRVSTAPSATPVQPKMMAPWKLADGGGWIRVRASVLDSLLAAGGELSTVRGAVSARAQDLAAIRDQLFAVISELGPSQGGEAVPGLVPCCAGLRSVHGRIERLAIQLENDLHALRRAASAVEAHARRARMLPFAEVWPSLARLIRDVAHTRGKDVEAVLDGGEVELDRAMLDRIIQPLGHLVRNAVDHGIEAPAERIAAGKPGRGCVRISVALGPRGVEIIVADDGRGLDVEALRQAARARGLQVPSTAGDIAQLAFHAGLSTVARADDVSGRGIGLDIVAKDVKSLGGGVVCTFEPDRGTKVSLTLPLTLTSMRAVLVEAGRTRFAIADTYVQRVLQIQDADGACAPSAPALAHGTLEIENRCLPAIDLSVLTRTSTHPSVGEAQDAAPSIPTTRPALLLEAGTRCVALIVDKVLDDQEVVVQGLGPLLVRIPYLSGAAVLPAGDVALILAPNDVLDQATATGQPLARFQAR